MHEDQGHYTLSRRDIRPSQVRQKSLQEQDHYGFYEHAPCFVYTDPVIIPIERKVAEYEPNNIKCCEVVP